MFLRLSVMKKSHSPCALLAPCIAALLVLAPAAFANDAVYVHRNSQSAVNQDTRLWTIPPISKRWGIPHRSSHWTIPRSAADLLPPGKKKIVDRPPN